MKPRHICKMCKIDEDSLRFMEAAMNRLGLSARAYNRILKVARTIADIEGSDPVRSLDRRIN